MSAPVAPRARRETWLAYLLLIFLGGFGVHRFYLGDNSAGVAMLVLLLVGSLLTVVLIGFAMLAALGVWLVVELFTLPGAVRRANGER